MKKKISKYLLYSMFFSFCFAIFLYFTFPYDKLKTRLISEIAQNGPAELDKIELKSLRPSMFTGVTLEKLKVSIKNRAEMQEFFIDEAVIRLTIGSIFRLLKDSVAGIFSGKGLGPKIVNDLSLTYSFEAYEGKGKGALSLGNNKFFKLESKALNLSKMKFLSNLSGGGDIRGKVKQLGINIGFPSDNPNNITGNIILNIDNVSLDDVKVQFFKLPSISISSLDVNLKAKNGHVVIQKCLVKGDLEGKIKGNLKLEPSLAYSSLNVNIKIKPSGEILDQYSSLLPMLRVKPDSTGSYNFTIGGTFSSPQLKTL